MTYIKAIEEIEEIKFYSCYVPLMNYKYDHKTVYEHS